MTTRKRNRWESSSDEEDEPPKSISKPHTHTKSKPGKITVSLESTDSSESENTNDNGTANDETSLNILTNNDTTKKFSLHNPLTMGCRSVYDSYERLDRLDEGTYGVVWKARDLATNEIVALKQIKFDSQMLKEGFPISAMREINVLLALSHQSIVTVREMVVGNDFDKYFMVMEVSFFKIIL